MDRKGGAIDLLGPLFRRDKPNPDAINAYLTRITETILQAFITMHIWGGMVGRGIEVVSYMFRNLNTAKRTIFWISGLNQILLSMLYNKSRNQSE